MDLCSVDVSFMPLCTAFVILGPSFDTWTVHPSFIYTTNLGNFIDISFLPSIPSLNRFLDSAALDAPSLMSNYIFNTPPPIPWFDLSFLPAHDGGSTDRFAATMCQCRHPLHTLVPLQLSLFRVIAWKVPHQGSDLPANGVIPVVHPKARLAFAHLLPYEI